MTTYTLVIDKADQQLINITCVHPEPLEAFAFIPVGDDKKVEVSTTNKSRFNRRKKAMSDAGKPFEESLG